MESLIIVPVIISIFFIILFIMMVNNIGAMRKDLRKITSYLTEEKYLVYMTKLDEWMEFTWEKINKNVAYIKTFPGGESFEVRKKLTTGFDFSSNYKALKKFDNLQEAANIGLI